MVKFSKKQLSKKQRRKKQNATRKLKGGVGGLTEKELKDKSIKELFQTLANKQKKAGGNMFSHRKDNINLLVEKINLKSTSPAAKLTNEAQVAAGPTGDPGQNRSALTEIRTFVGGAGGVDDEFIDNTFSYLMLTDDDGGGGGGGGGGGDGGVGGDDGGGGGGISNDVVQCETSNDDSGINNEGRTTVMYNKKTKKISFMNKDPREEDLGVLNVVICGIDEKPVGGARVKMDDTTRKVFKVYFHTNGGTINFEKTNFSIDINEDNNSKNFIEAMMERQNEILKKSHDEINKVIDEPSTEGGLIRNRGFLKGDGDDDEFKVEE